MMIEILLEDQRHVRANRSRDATCLDGHRAARNQFQQAMEDYKRRSGRLFPTWSEVLEVLRDLGYARSSGDPIRPNPPIVRVNRGDLTGVRIGEVLASRGGHPSRREGHACYVFESDDDRDNSLDAVRCEFGWSSVDPLYE
jgi:hypothetical protein